MELQFNQVTKSFGDLDVIKRFDTTIKTGEIVALVGPSGCGKSTVLHMVAGLQSASSGTLTADGKSVSRSTSIGSELTVTETNGFPMQNFAELKF